MNRPKEVALCENFPEKIYAELKYRGTASKFKVKPFYAIANDLEHSLCVIKTKKGHVYGMFTDLYWSEKPNGKDIKGLGNSFCFKFDNDKITKFKSKKGKSEIYHSKWEIFAMGRYCPYALNLQGDTNARLDVSFEAEGEIDRNTVLAKEQFPEV